MIKVRLCQPEKAAGERDRWCAGMCFIFYFFFFLYRRHLAPRAEQHARHVVLMKLSRVVSDDDALSLVMLGRAPCAGAEIFLLLLLRLPRLNAAL